MALQDMTTQDVLLQQLAQRVGALSAEQKAKEAAIKELDTQIKLAEAESGMKIRAAQDAYERKKAELAVAIAPLQSLRDEIPRLHGEIAKLKQAKLDATAEIKAAKGVALHDANALVSAATMRLAKIEVAIQHCKAQVETL